MVKLTSLTGVYAAAVTPLNPDLSPHLDAIAELIQFLAGRGCHGALILGTTGEGPSFSREERGLIYQAASLARENVSDFHLLAGTGTPSLEETIFFTHSVFDMGYEGVVILPPYYYKKTTDDGLFNWFSRIMDQAVPEGGVVLGYHIPPISGVGFSLDLLSRLKDAYPGKFAGIKDSSGDAGLARSLGTRFGKDLMVFNGNDHLFSLALEADASGCITAMANVLSPLHRHVWDSFQAGIPFEIIQDKLSTAREVLDRYPPLPPLIKLLLSRLHSFSYLKMKPPLMEFDPEKAEIVLSEFLAALE